MNFKNRLTTDNLLTSTNLVIAVCILTIILVLYKSCSEEKPKTPPVPAKKEVLRLAMPEDRVPVSPRATENLNPDIPSPLPSHFPNSIIKDNSAMSYSSFGIFR